MDESDVERWRQKYVYKYLDGNCDEYIEETKQ